MNINKNISKYLISEKFNNKNKSNETNIAIIKNTTQAMTMKFLKTITIIILRLYEYQLRNNNNNNHNNKNFIP